jgi:hypothetical protein
MEIKGFYNQTLENLLGERIYISENLNQKYIFSIENKDEICFYGYCDIDINGETKFTIELLKQFKDVENINLEFLKEKGFKICKMQNLIDFYYQTEEVEETYKLDKEYKITNETKTIGNITLNISYYCCY